MAYSTSIRPACYSSYLDDIKTESGYDDHINDSHWSGGHSPYEDSVRSPYEDVTRSPYEYAMREPFSSVSYAYTTSFPPPPRLEGGLYSAGTSDFTSLSLRSPRSATDSYQDSETSNTQRPASSGDGTTEYGYHQKEEAGSPYSQSAASPSASQDTKEQGFCCLYPNCNATIFKRKADLDRHYKHKHIPEDQQRAWRCDYPRCNRRSAEAPFRRKDHFRDHLRDFHKEDLGKRGKTITTDEYGQECNINNSWWRCPRCLIRVNVTRDGFQCPDCHTTCDDSRKRKRKHESSPYGSRR